jgi:exodeoxyribonuclease VII large subunit
MEVAREQFKERPVYVLSEITKSIQAVINRNYNKAYYIKAEILKLNFYPHSGHCYPELVEKEGDKIKTQLRAVIWASQYHNINERFRQITGELLKEGINILCLATVEFSPQYGLALYIQDIEPIYTLGELVKNRLAVIERLKNEGLFEANKKLDLALLPKRIAIISVETSKGYSDFMVTLNSKRKLFRFETELFPSILQGDKAVVNITQRLTEIEARKEQFDCVVLVRGGGGDVGLNCYDDYTMAQRVATFPLPVIAGIGHAVNETITGMVAHENKITPTEVAYFLIERFQQFADKIVTCQQTIVKQTKSILQEQYFYLDKIAQNCQIWASQTLGNGQTGLINLIEILKKETKQQLSSACLVMDHIESKTVLLNPKNILKRGFSITLFDGKPLTSNSNVHTGDEIVTLLHEGEVRSLVE